MPIDSCKFENGICSEITISNDTQNIFQIGTPHKLFFGNSYSQPNAIMTDSVYSYKKNNFSYFDYKFNFVRSGSGFHLSFRHKYETDSLKDGGYILFSNDTGVTWQNLAEVENMNYSGRLDTLYNFKKDTLFNGVKYAFTGNSNGWIYSRITFAFAFWMKTSHYTNWTNNIIIRFCFASDSIDNHKAGWIIDDLELRGITLKGGMEKTFNQIPITFSPNPSSTNINLTTSELIATKGYSIIVYNILGETIFAKEKITQANFNLNTSNFDDGIYQLKIHADGFADSFNKIVVQH
jgi:hypothetical protein